MPVALVGLLWAAVFFVPLVLVGNAVWSRLTTYDLDGEGIASVSEGVKELRIPFADIEEAEAMTAPEYALRCALGDVFLAKTFANRIFRWRIVIVRCHGGRVYFLTPDEPARFAERVNNMVAARTMRQC